MKITLFCDGFDPLIVEVEKSLPVSQIQKQVADFFQIPILNQAFFYNGKQMHLANPFSIYPIQEQDLIEVFDKTILKKNQVESLQQVMDQQLQQMSSKDKRMKELYDLEIQAQKDPYNPEIQKKIEELIQQNNIEENFRAAYDNIPESFTNIRMLYINCEINHVSIQAFIDTGAQKTIMNSVWAEKCGIMRLVDRHYAGFATGVGWAKIIGRVHLSLIKIGNSFFPSSFSIIEQDKGLGFIFGLDMLTRHQCLIDLKSNFLKIGDETIPFLAENQIQEKIQVDGHSNQEQKPIENENEIENQNEIENETETETETTEDVEKVKEMDQENQNQNSTQFENSTINNSNDKELENQNQDQNQNQNDRKHKLNNSNNSSQNLQNNLLNFLQNFQVPTNSNPNRILDENKIQQIIQQGASREEAIQLLRRAGGNVEIAKSFFFENF